MKFFLFSVVSVMCFGLGYFAPSETLWGPKCPICYDVDIASCPNIQSSPTCEPILEPNCGCCKMCARRRGETCGVGKGLCGTGLRCVPTKTASKTLGSILAAYMGKLICATKDDLRLNFPELYSLLYDEEEENSKQIGATDAAEEEDVVIPHRISPPKGFSRQQTTRPPAVPASFLDRQEPCYDQYDMVWKQEYFLRHDWVPECGQTGFYKPLQCELTHGLVKGRCWCVDRQGSDLSGFLPGPNDAKKSDCATYLPELSL